ncbi:hypothetical protein, partial [Streptomyces sp. UNOC14_S4]|uniref:hypothetical protein n=1 Tax=Streptomyces sp. UNOC14_S4 TaxID=2872340 RepID=UPI001E50244F
PGFGKRSAPGQKPRTAADFAHLSAREAYIAAYIDRLPDGAAIDIKTLAKQLAAFGQMAVRTALRLLEQAGHLFRRRETVGDGGTQWVWRTYFSRTPRSESWWQRFRKGDVPPDEPKPQPQEQAQPQEETPRRSAYGTLAGAGLVDPRMSLSAAECAELRPLAEEWFARGATEDDIERALTANLPPEVHVPGAFARRRLVDKLPPQREAPPAPEPHRPLAECEVCRAPGRSLPGGRCRTCRGDDNPHEGWLGESIPEPLAESIHRKADAVRAGIIKNPLPERRLGKPRRRG